MTPAPAASARPSGPTTGHWLDRLARGVWRATGRRVDLDGEHHWLRAPVRTSDVDDPAEAWMRAEADRHGGTVRAGVTDAGLQPDWDALAGPGFDPARIHPLIVDFYRHTAAWRMEVWSGWSPVFWPGGQLVSWLFGRRVQQLALPMHPLDVARGMDSSVAVITDREGRQVSAGWTRTLRSTGDVVFSGCYARRRLPGAERPSVHVTFPLDGHNVQVFLAPEHRAGGGLRLSSPGGRWGGDGAYVVVDTGRGHRATPIPIHETFDLAVDDEGVLRTDHVLRVGDRRALALHYRLERRP